MKRIFVITAIGLFLLHHIVLSQEEKKTEPEPEISKQQTAPVLPEPAPAPALAPDRLTMFGHNLFTVSEAVMKNMSAGGVMFPETYLLGPGDHIAIYLLGKFQQTFDVIVNAEGKIFIPTVGIFYVASFTIEELRTFLEKQLSRYYDNFSLNLMLLEPKKIPVMVAGEVNRPGKYFLSSLNTVLDAVVMAGGPTARGSIRNIQMHRQDHLLETIDFYQFLMTGKIENETFLQLNDRIIIPILESVVTITGEVKRQVRFELKKDGNEKLSHIIHLAGGFTEMAFLNKIEISRLLPDGTRTVFYVNYHEILADENCPSNIFVKHQDQIHIFSIQEQTYPKYVYIHGEVKRPGTYPLEKNLHVLDLILKAGNLTRSAFVLECELAKIDPKKPTTSIKINLQNLFQNHDSRDNWQLEEDDRLFIRRIPEWEVGLTVEVTGEVQFPGMYAITRDSTTLGEIIEKAGGFTDKALIRESSLIRSKSKITIDKEHERLKMLPRDQMSRNEYLYLVMKENTQDVGRIVVDFYRLCITKNKSEDVILEDGDVINVPRIPKVVYVTGRVGIPGGVLFHPNKGINYYVKKAGGAAWDAKTRGIKVTKVTGEVIDDEDVKKLEPGDIIWVPRKSDRDWWGVFGQTIAIIAQLATVYLVVDNAINK